MVGGTQIFTLYRAVLLQGPPGDIDTMTTLLSLFSQEGSPAHPDGLVDGVYPVLDVAALLVVVAALLLLHRAEGRHVGLVAVGPVPAFI